ncbi:MAG: ABC transporter ATP-binding protein [Acidobacteria bacterium]|nr:MAG: ABC transporter ATP-binding protein [Acidobacteriota bacterium]REK08440.1 MAG: ABC transporter ATP-binding protein [Acidobacteriota bacterium]
MVGEESVQEGAAPEATWAGAGRARIELRDVHKSFGPKHVLRGLDLTVRDGDSLVILGGSGTGKSVLVQHLIGLMRPDRGSVLVDGEDLAALSSAELTTLRQRFGMSFQEGALFDSLTVFDNVGFLLERLGTMTRAEIRDRVFECLELVRLEGTAQRLPSELSGGMRRRVGFARAIAHKPEILLFDEPNTGLDPVTSAVIDELIIRMREKLHSTTVTITHDLRSAFTIATRLVLLHQGQIAAEGTPEEMQASEDGRVQQFLSGEAHGPLTDDEEAEREARRE